MADVHVHTIRLKGPWGVRGSQECEFERRSLPTEWPSKSGWLTFLGDQCDQMTLKRNFHTPSNLGPNDRVLIRVPDCLKVVSFEANQKQVFSVDSDTQRFDVTPTLESFNELMIVIDYDPMTLDDSQQSTSEELSNAATSQSENRTLQDVIRLEIESAE